MATRFRRTLRGSTARASLCLTIFFAMVGCGSNTSSEIGDKPQDGQSVNAKIAKVDGAPFEITACDAVLSSTKNTSGDIVPHLWVHVHAKNISSKTITALKVQYINFDGFDTAAGGDTESYRGENFTLSGELDAGDDSGSDYVFDHIAKNVAKITCTPAQAAFKDKSSWVNSSLEIKG